MLAYTAKPHVMVGHFSPTLHARNTFVYQLVELIEAELAVWRDDSQRPKETAEYTLTEQLCIHLNGVTRKGPWDIVQFTHETQDRSNRRRTLDISIGPSNEVINIRGSVYTRYDIITPIECKRLPTPRGTGRDDREYVFSQYTKCGGMQRFKCGVHGGLHSLALMIAYIQEDTPADWKPRVCQWVSDLAANGEPGWSDEDVLRIDSEDAAGGIMKLRSNHEREGKLAPIELWHLWVKMN